MNKQQSMSIIYKVCRLLPMACFCIAVTSLQAQKLKAVDLGLSVRWANMNVGASSPEDYGEYFAWGEVKPKRYYGVYSQYKHFDDRRFSKYNYLAYRGSVMDDMLQLQPTDDAACKQLKKGWRMPTEVEVMELLEKCTLRHGESNGTRGVWAISRTEPSDSIFLPMTGYKEYGNYRSFPGTQGYYWTSTLLTADSLASVKENPKASDMVRSAKCMMFQGVDKIILDMFDRRNGCAIRPVCR